MLFVLNSPVLASLATLKDWVLPGMGNEDKADLAAILLYLFAWFGLLSKLEYAKCAYGIVNMLSSY
jgi:hypothetical protein